jgi:hypothetical protein
VITGKRENIFSFESIEISIVVIVFLSGAG